MNELVSNDEEFGNLCVLANSLAPIEEEVQEKEGGGIWLMHVDGAQSRIGVGARIVLMSLEGSIKTFSYKLKFDCTNNIAKYESFCLGLELARDMGTKKS